MKSINIGLIGFGTVGTGVARLLTEQRELLARRLGTPLVLKKVADLDLARARSVALPADCLTTRAEDILDDPEIDIVVELIGGTTAARDYVLEAIARGKHVVTANKALLAHHGNDLLAAAAAAGVEVAFEASVCGGIPIILALRQGLAANRIQELFGILNGTANYILTQMTQSGASYADALAEAQAHGYAEADPTLDVEGIDTAHKLAILMSLAYGSQLDLESIAVEGISRLNPLDLQFAGEFGYCLKLLAITRDDGHRVEARVHPTLVPRDHMLANVNGAMNAVYLTGDAVGPILLYGQGAGMMPTASAVVSDLIDLARNLLHGVPGRVPALGWESALSTQRPHQAHQRPGDQLLSQVFRPGPARGPVPGLGHPGKTQHQHRRGDPEGPGSGGYGAHRHDHPRSPGGRRPPGHGRDRPVAQRLPAHGVLPHRGPPPPRRPDLRAGRTEGRRSGS